MNEPETPAVVNNEGEAPPSVPDEKKEADVTPSNSDDEEESNSDDEEEAEMADEEEAEIAVSAVEAEIAVSAVEAEIAVPADEAAADVRMDDDDEDDDEPGLNRSAASKDDDDDGDDGEPGLNRSADSQDYDEDEDDDEPGLNRSANSSFSSDIPPPPTENIEVDTDAEEEVPSDEEHEEPETPKTVITVVTSSPPSKEDMSKYTTKIAARLDKAVEDSVGHQHRSPDLVPLTTNYQTMRKRLRSMVKSAKSYQKATRQLEDARSNLYQEFSVLAKDTPLNDHVGKLLDADSLLSIEKISHGDNFASLATTMEGLELQTKTVSQVAEDFGARSMASLQQLHNIHEKLNVDDYQQHVLGYVLEWEQVITTRIDKELANVKKLRQDRFHYERKVEILRRKVNQAEQKGKEVPEEKLVRLQRNEQKLKDSFELHEQRAGKLCVLLEQVTEQGWQDLYPFVKNAMKWEVNRLGRENVTYGRLPITLDAMKATFQQHVELEQIAKPF